MISNIKDSILIVILMFEKIFFNIKFERQYENFYKKMTLKEINILYQFFDRKNMQTMGVLSNISLVLLLK